MKTINPDWPDLPSNVRVLSTTRYGGASLGPYDDGYGGGGLNLGNHVGDDIVFVLKNRNSVNQFMPYRTLNYLSQVHGVDVVDASKAQDGYQADGCYSQQENIPCAVLTADCLPVLMCDMQGAVVAALHAGWRGLANGILQAGVMHCRQLGGHELTVWLGPAIGPQQFEVGQDVVEAFVKSHTQARRFFIPQSSVTNVITNSGASSVSNSGTKYLADIYGLARMILNELGIDRVHGGQYCTVTQSDLFYSYRRDGVTGRMANIIWKTN